MCFPTGVGREVEAEAASRALSSAARRVSVTRKGLTESRDLSLTSTRVSDVGAARPKQGGDGYGVLSRRKRQLDLARPTAYELDAHVLSRERHSHSQRCNAFAQFCSTCSLDAQAYAHAFPCSARRHPRLGHGEGSLMRAVENFVEKDVEQSIASCGTGI